MSNDDWGKLMPPVQSPGWPFQEATKEEILEKYPNPTVDPWLNVQAPIHVVESFSAVHLFKLDEQNKLFGSPSLGNHKKMDKRILVFECNTCDDELDVNTTSFIKLVEAAKEAGWVMKWLDIGYNIWCPHCKGNHS